MLCFVCVVVFAFVCVGVVFVGVCLFWCVVFVVFRFVFCFVVFVLFCFVCVGMFCFVLLLCL